MTTLPCRTTPACNTWSRMSTSETSSSRLCPAICTTLEGLSAMSHEGIRWPGAGHLDAVRLIGCLREAANHPVEPGLGLARQQHRRLPLQISLAAAHFAQASNQEIGRAHV